VPAPNKFAALAAHATRLVRRARRAQARSPWRCSRSPTTSACSAAGRAAGLGELRIPENEPGSSIMPGKVNPTQSESMTMVCVQVHRQRRGAGHRRRLGQFELNVYRPLVIRNFLHSATLLARACASFERHCVARHRARPQAHRRR
jgi:fumarate hydratase class II